MSRPPRKTPKGYAYHVYNRGFLRSELFADELDYRCFLDLLGKTLTSHPIELSALCLMPNHWHLCLWPNEENVVSRFMQHLTSRHVSSWRKRWGTSGHLYQGRFKCIPVATESYYFRLVEYVELNPVRAKLAEQAEDWRWSSAWIRSEGANGNEWGISLSQNPIPVPGNWLSHLRERKGSIELTEIERCITLQRPFGQLEWVSDTVNKLALPRMTRRRPRENSP